MKKFFEDLAVKFDDAAYETQLDDFSCEFDAVNKPAEVKICVKSRTITNVNGQRKSYPYYDVEKVCIFDEDGKDVSAKYPNFCKEVKNCVPCYSDVKEAIQEANMTPEELYFGSYQGYLNYRYG